MFKHTRDILLRELGRWPGVSHELVRRSKHWALVLRYGERERTHVFSGTRTDNRATLNSLTLLRRTLRELGAQKAEAA